MSKNSKDDSLGPFGITLPTGTIVKRKGYASLDPNKNPYLPDNFPTTYEQWMQIHSGGSGQPKDSGAAKGGTCPLTYPDFYADYSGVWLGADGVSSGEAAECKHQPIDVGFRFTKMVCKKCNKDLKE